MIHVYDLSNSLRCLWYVAPASLYKILVLNPVDDGYDNLHYRGTLEQLDEHNRFGDNAVYHSEIYGTVYQGVLTSRGAASGSNIRFYYNGVWIQPDLVVRRDQAGIVYLPNGRYAYSFGPVGEDGFEVVKGTKRSNGKWLCGVDCYRFLPQKVTARLGSAQKGPLQDSMPETPYYWSDPGTSSRNYGGLLTKAPAYNINYELKQLELQCRRSISDVVPSYEHSIVYGDLSQTVANNAKVVDTNLITLIPELINFKAGLQATVDVWNQAFADRTLKGLSNAYLSTLYGSRLTVLDVRDQALRIQEKISDYQLDDGVCVTHARDVKTGLGIVYPFYGSPVIRTYTLKCYYKGNVFADNVFDALSRLSLMPQLTDAWDMVPFSFVVDWFVDVQSLLDDIDARVYVTALPVLSTVRGYKAETNVSVSLTDSSFFLGRYELYERRIVRHLTLPRPSLDGTDITHFGHVPEATALLIQSIG